MNRSEIEAILDNSNFIQLNKWMFQLGINGNTLLVFAYLYSFSRDGESVFSGTVGHLSNLINVSKPTIHKSLNDLIGRGLITKIENVVNGVSLPNYKQNKEGVIRCLQGVKNLDTPSKETLHPPVKKLYTPCKETLHHNNIYNNKINNINNNISEKEFSQPTSDSIDENFSSEKSESIKPKENPPQKVAPKSSPKKTKEQEREVAKSLLLEDGICEEAIDTWFSIRKEKNLAILTPYGWELAKKEGKKVNISPAELVDECITRGWGGFRAEYHTNAKKSFNKQDDPTFFRSDSVKVYTTEL